MITISDDAVEFIISFLEEESKKRIVCRHDIRLSVEKSGCNGNRYSIAPINVHEINNDCLKLEESNKIVVWYDVKDEYLIRGCHITLQEDLISKKILITNPSLKIEMCGCGESFTF